MEDAPEMHKYYRALLKRLSRPSKWIIAIYLLSLTVGAALAATSTYLVARSSTSGATANSTQKRMVRTSDGTLHSLVQTGTQTTTCNSVSKSGLLWMYSTDNGVNWICGDQLSSDTTNLMYGSATVDANDNVYITYSVAANGGAAANDLYFRKLTKGSGSSWTMEAAATVADANVLTSYSYSVMEVEGTTRLWLASRYFDGSNYQVVVYYSDGLSANPVWTVSQSPLDSPNTNAAYHFPAMVRFGSKIGVIYNAVIPTNVMRWRVRSDSDPLTTWSTDNIVSANVVGSPLFTVIADVNENIYFAMTSGVNIWFNYFNGSAWSATSVVATTAISSSQLTLSTDGANVWVFYNDTTNLVAGFYAPSKLVYKKGIAPFTNADFDINPTTAVNYHGTFNKYWSYVGASYLDDTTDASNVTLADTRMVTAIGDIAYFGKAEKFDAVEWALSTAGVGGVIAWEYWNGTTWTSLTFTVNSYSNFTGNTAGWAAFTDPSDWATTTVNSEGTPYYYIRARTTTAFTTAPVANQLADLPYTAYPYFLPAPIAGSVNGVWSENYSSPIRVRNGSVTVTTGTPNSAGTASLAPNTVGFSSTTLASQASTQRHIVKTSDGTIHAFVQAGTEPGCGGSTTANNTIGLVWINSTDNGVTWNCGGQLSYDTNYLMYASAAVDSADNIYVTYSVSAGGAFSAYDVFYRKLTKGAGSSWTLGGAQAVLDADNLKGYSYATIEVEGTSRAWIAARYFDGASYQVSMYYSSDLSDAPAWTVSQVQLSTPYYASDHSYPVIVRFGSKIGVIYNTSGGLLGNSVRWRYRTDGDALTSWTPESLVNNGTDFYQPTFTAISDGSDNVYFAGNRMGSDGYIYLSYWNGVSWTINSASYPAGPTTGYPIGLVADGTNVWVTYFENLNLVAGYSGSYKLMYRKITAPYNAANFDTVGTPLISYHTILDKYWSFYSSAYTNDTTDAGSTGASDTQMVSQVGDIAYFGKTAKFDAVSWLLSTNGVGGQVVWEYYNGSAWVAINKFMGVANSTFWGTGYISFVPPSNWATVAVNGEGTPNYYVRARTVTAFTTIPVATQISTIPVISWAATLPQPVDGKIGAIWTENNTVPTRIRYGTSPVVTTTPNTVATAEIAPSVVGFSATTNAVAVSSQRHLVRTSDGTLHTFVQASTRQACGNSTGANNTWGLVWIYSTDNGTTWNCGGQITSDYNMYPSATSDSAGNLYVTYSALADGSSTTYNTFYRKLTKGSGANWTIEAQQKVLDAGSGLVGYTYSVIEAEGTNRLWLATRYYDGTYYQVSTYYSDSMSTAPTWTLSQATLGTPNASAIDNHPAIVRFGNKIGVVYEASLPAATQRWRWRSDSDSLTSWSPEQMVSAWNINYGYFAVESDAAGNVYHVANNGGSIIFSYWNGTAWSATTSVSAVSAGGLVGLSTDGSNVWVFYNDSTGFTGQGGGARKLVYKKGIAPYSASEFDIVGTPVVSYHGTFDKYWSYLGGAYTNDTTDSGNIVAADTQMISAIGDIAYFGKSTKYDAVSWDLTTGGTVGNVVWEYYNGSAWVSIPDFHGISAPTFWADGYLTFIPPFDWATTTVNGEATPYYYVRARVTTAFAVAPVGAQMHDFVFPTWANFLASPVNNNIYGIFSENIPGPVRVRATTTAITTSTPNVVSSSNLSHGVLSSSLYSSDLNATGPSTERHMVRTSDGTIHAFVQAQDAPPCSAQTDIANKVGLVWIYSTDSGQNWVCGGQMSDDRGNLYDGSAAIDGSDNVYVVYSVSIAGANQSYDVIYRKLSKGSGRTWTMGAAQVALDASVTTGYSYATLAVDGSSRLWIASRYFDGSNYQVNVSYSNNLSDTPTWAVSQSSLGTAGTNAAYHYPAIVRFGSKIGVVYEAQATTDLRWRYRDDGDGLTSWSADTQVMTTNPTTPAISVAGDASGNVYVAMNRSTTIQFTRWNGSVWSTPATVSSSAPNAAFVALSLVGSNVYIYYGDTTGISGALPASRKLVYKKGVSPYATANFDVNPTSVVTYHGLLDKYWSYNSSVYTNDTADALDVDTTNTASSGVGTDVQLVSQVGDIAYFGKSTKFDALSWYLTVNGANGMVKWEYYNGSSWVEINKYLGVNGPSFTSSGYISFMPPSDWATTTLNSEATPYYYLRARTVVAYTTAPVGGQMGAMAYVNWITSVESAANLYYLWTENTTMPLRLRFDGYEFNVAPNTPSQLSPSLLTSGGATSSAQPALGFTTSDTNIGETATYRIQIDDSADFATPVVNYLSALLPVGNQTFTVGQATGGGNYDAGASGQSLADGNYYWRVMATDQGGLTAGYATANAGEIAFSVDTTRPVTNAGSVLMLRSAGLTGVASNGWTNQSTPYFSWSAGVDNDGGSLIKGYCLYLGSDAAGDPTTAKGLLGTSPVDTTSSSCQFIVSGTSIDLSELSYHGNTWLTTSNSPYYLNVKAIDNTLNVFSPDSASFQFRYDDTAPVNVGYISPSGGSFNSVADMSFSWPIVGGSASIDANSQVLGWQYQLNTTDGTWLGSSTDATLSAQYIPNTESLYHLSVDPDEASVVNGSNTVYFRTIDRAGNVSSASTIRAGSLQFGGQAPTFEVTANVTIDPEVATTNEFSVSYPEASSGVSTIAHYYYMINTTPPSTLATLQSNSSTYIDNGTALEIVTSALPNVNKGTNTIYVVAVDDAGHYSPSNYISGDFTLNSTDPDNVGNLIASDSSIKSMSQWNIALTWTAPSYQGAGNLSYLIFRSLDGSLFTQVGSATGLAYVDNVSSSDMYYYKVYTKDGASARSSGTNAVSLLPTGKWTSAPSLDSGPTTTNITTKKATVSWTTSRGSDSKVQYGTSSGSYESVEPSNSTQTSAHTIQLTGLNPGTAYYYRTKWTDEDGNTGISDEKSFSTAPAPSTKDVSAKSVGLTSAMIQFTSTGANEVKIYYGQSTSFGGTKTVSTSVDETTYTVELSGLLDGTKYYYQINTFDTDKGEYAGTILDFTTLPKPKISQVRVQQVTGTAQSTLLISWLTNTEVSSIVTFYPVERPGEAKDEVNVALTKGEHKTIVRGLLPQTNYYLIVKGRDKAGNEAASDIQKLTTATDTRPPQIEGLHVEGSNVPLVSSSGEEQNAQLVVSWNTDEPSTSQVEFGEGTGSVYNQKTQEDGNLTLNHLVIIGNLTPSKVYHLRAISVDKAKNIGNSIDSVTITPKATENALNLVISNLQQAFGFLKGVTQ